MILELTGQPYFDLKRNNSKKNVSNKCLINCRIDSLSSNLKDKNHTSVKLIQHCFHCGLLHNRDTILACLGIQEKILHNLYLTVIFQIIIKCDAHAQNSKYLFIYISAVSESMFTQINFENHQKKNTENHF